MFYQRQQKLKQNPKMATGTETAMNATVLYSNQRRNYRNSGVANCLTSENRAHNGFLPQTGPKGSGDQHVKRTLKNTSSIQPMLESSNHPMSLVEPEYLKNFGHLRVTRLDGSLVPSTQNMPTNHDNSNSRPCNYGSSRFNNNKPRDDSKYVKNCHAYSPRAENRFDSNRWHKNDNYPRCNNNNSNYSTLNGSLRNNGHFNNNTDGLVRDNKIELETVNSDRLKERKTVYFSLAKNSMVELDTCKNAWVPRCRNSQQSTNTNDTETEDILKKVRSTLNKITPENMIELTKSITAMPISTFDCLDKMIELLFQKAIDEPSYTPQYAYICSQMKEITVISEENRTKISFKELILLKCQKTFKLVSAQEKIAADCLLKIKTCKDQTLKNELNLKYDEDERTQRKRSVGNCRFMCEIFKVKLLNSHVMEMCIQHLLKCPKEEPLECLCNILKHVGRYLKTENTFKTLREFSSVKYKSLIPSRIRFMILDVIELKNNNWVPRNAEVKPKLMSKIEQECTEEIEGPKRNVKTNIKKVNTQSPIVQIKNEMCSNSRKDTTIEKGTVKNIVDFFNKEESKRMEVGNSSLTKNRDVELNRCKNAWVPRNRRSQKSTKTNDIEIKESCETVHSIVYSTTPENVVSSTNKLILRISSPDLVEEAIDVLFKRAITEPSCTSLVVEICSLLKGIVLNIDNGSKQVSFKKQLSVRCQKLMRIGKFKCGSKSEILVVPAYTLIGELFNKKLVPLNVMIEFIKDIPSRMTDAFAENTFQLLKVVGAQIERPYSLKPTMKQLEATVINGREGSISPKCKDAVLNLLKLRNNKWIPVEKIDSRPTIAKTNKNVTLSHIEKNSSKKKERRKQDSSGVRNIK